MTTSRTARHALLLAVGLAGLCGLTAQAQTVYRIVGPDGKVTFSDRAPEKVAPGERSTALAVPETGSSNASLPYELRQVVQRFPVTLYSDAQCPPCDSARSMLVARGIPFSERTVATNEDIDALKRLSGSANLPFGTIGSQQLVGYSETEWTQYLDAAGYPKQSQLPRNYQRAPASPLVEAKPAQPAQAPASKPDARRRVAPAPAPSGPTPSNPAGIRF
ncbi:MAG: NrdH-redoxin [Burkholderiaceae bacterium]|jgi:glutaredoxin|nr:glutaredoxin family protein [Burkholderiaceae bacterium]MCO5105096.1 NrdH-redoxin [Burkholderiaceae bacterium]